MAIVGDPISLAPAPVQAQNLPSSSRHYAGLDGVRGLAIIAVLIVHSCGGLLAVMPEAWANAFAPLFGVGVFGVDLFFVLSGFLITGILLRSKNSPTYFRTFYARRVMRLAPLYYGYLVLVGLGMPLFHRLTHSSMADYQGNWWWYLCYVSNWKPNRGASDPFLGHFWSLAVEEQFYCLWPLIVYRLSRKNLARLCWSVIAVAFGLRVWLALSDAHWNTIYRSTFTRFDTLAFGALVALALSSDRWREVWLRWRHGVGLAGAALFMGLVCWVGSPNWDSHSIQIAAPVFACLAFSSLITYAVVKKSRFLEMKWLRAAGRYSYAAYVLHGIIFEYMTNLEAFLCRRTLNPEIKLAIGLAIFVVAQPLVFLVARASWQYFEGPIQHWKDRVFRPANA